MNAQDAANLIKKHRTVVLNLKQEDYGKLFDVSGASVSRWESGNGMELETWLRVVDRLEADGVLARRMDPNQPVEPPKRKWLRFSIAGRPPVFLEYHSGEEVRFQLSDSVDMGGGGAELNAPAIN